MLKKIPRESCYVGCCLQCGMLLAMWDACNGDVDDDGADGDDDPAS